MGCHLVELPKSLKSTRHGLTKWVALVVTQSLIPSPRQSVTDSLLMLHFHPDSAIYCYWKDQLSKTIGDACRKTNEKVFDQHNSSTLCSLLEMEPYLEPPAQSYLMLAFTVPSFPLLPPHPPPDQYHRSAPAIRLQNDHITINTHKHSPLHLNRERRDGSNKHRPARVLSARFTELSSAFVVRIDSVMAASYAVEQC